MKKAIVWLILIAFILTAAAAAVLSQTIRETPKAPVFTEAERHAELAKRRKAVADQMADDSMLVLFSARPRLYTGDVDYVYRQENNLFYLTGLNQASITLVIYKNAGKVTEFLFVPKRSYFAETWNGKMYSTEEVQSISGIQTVIPASEQKNFLGSVKSAGKFTSTDSKVSINAVPAKLYFALPYNENDSDGDREFDAEASFSKTLSGKNIENPREIIDPLRQIKSPYELRLLQHAIDITTEAHERAMSMVGKANWEYEVQAEVEYTFRRRNADFWGYASIVGCGPNATTLHYVESQGPVKKGEVLLMDVGAEYQHYTADVTRTFPVNGKFTKEQADIYRIVYNAQEAAAAKIKPGANLSEISEAADKVIIDGLYDLGLITDKNSNQYRIWYMHGLSHWLGMNVHDVGEYDIAFKPGMVFTNEPGIYIRAEALDNLPPGMEDFAKKVRPAFEKYKNIGIRIEDDMLVTETGTEWMTKALPRKLEDIESFIRRSNRIK